MPSTSNCPTCGAPLPSEAPEGLCPKCLLQAGLGEPTQDSDGREPQSTVTRPPFRVRYVGDYELQAEIAQGGMGIVYRGRQVSLDRPVALKMILPNKLDDEAVKRFHQEAESAANLDHPNIVPVYEVGKHQGQHFLSMRLIDGRSLKEDLPRLRKDRRAGARLMATVARAVHHAHQRGVLHRDLKPHNILVDRDGQPHVTDFGLAKRVSAGREVTATGAWAGTPEYMSPEQAAGEFKSLTTAADIYSLGAMLYTLLTGVPPFQGSYPGILRQITDDEPARPRMLDRRVDPDLETICLKCLAKDPDGRYTTAGDLADDLDRWLGGEPIAARPVSRWERARKWVRRKPAIAALSAAVLLIGLVGLAGVLWQWRVALNNERRARASEQKEVAARVDAQHQRNEAVQANTSLQDALWRARRNAYFGHLSLAQREWDRSNIERARELLENRDEAEFRGFEWYSLKRLYYPERLTLKGHIHGVTGVAFSPDGSRVISASTGPTSNRLSGERITSSGAATVKVWDAASGRELLTLDGAVKAIGSVQNVLPNNRFGLSQRPNDVRGLAMSPDGKRLAAASSDETIKVWDAATGQELLTLKGHTKDVTCVAFSPDGNRIASASIDGTVKLWDTRTCRALLTFTGHNDRVNGVAFSPDGNRLASSGGATVKLWDTGSGQELLAIKRSARFGATGLAYSPDGKRFTAESTDETVKVWDAASGRELLTLRGHAGWVQALAFSPDGKRIASASEDTSIKLWDAGSGQELHTFKGHISSVTSVAFSPDGERLASASLDRTVKLWDVAYNREPLTLADETKAGPGETMSSADVRGLSFSPDSKRLAWGRKDGTVTLNDATTGRELRTLRGHSRDVRGVSFSPDGTRLASASMDQTVKLWDATNGQELFTRKAGADPPIEWRIRDAATGQELMTLKGHAGGGGATGVSFSPDGQRVAATSLDQTVKVWDPASGRELLSLDDHPIASWGGMSSPDAVRGVSFSPNGQRLAAGSKWDASVRLWDAATGLERLILKGHASVKGVAFSPDGSRLAAAYADWTARIWDTISGRELLTLTGHTAEVNGVAFSPDGKRLATASADRTVKLWDTATGQELLTLKGHNHIVMGVTFSADGKRLASVCNDDTVNIWVGEER